MKTGRFLLAALALICLCGNVAAQRDITSQYITNATLSNGTTGWTVSNFNAPQRGNNTVGYASEAYAGWSNLDITSYSLTQTITLPKGTYRLVNYSFFRQGLRYNSDASKSLAYLKAGSAQVAIKTLGSISGIPTNGDNGGYANSQAEGANCFDSKMYRNVVEFEIASDNTSIEIGLVGTFDLKQSWVIAGMFELFDMNDAASVSSPTDVTYAITNPGFEYRNTTGWTTNGIVYQNNNWSDKAGIGFAEKWQENPGLPNASITQTLTGLENGLYELSVYGHNINQKDNNAAGAGMYLTANGAQTGIGAFGQYKVRANVTDGTLTIGITLDNCTGNWIAFDRFQLQFYGDPDAAILELITTYQAEAEGLLSSSDASYLTDASKSILQQAVADALSASSENLSAALENLINVIDSTRQIIQDVKTNRALMLEALQRFENDYNLADGTDYRRVTMSAKAWTDLIDKVNAVSTALDDASQASNYGAIKDELVAQMNATDVSLRLFKSYKAMVDGTTALSIVGGYDADANMDTDAAEENAIAALNTAFGTYANTQGDDFSVSAFLGDNLDFSAAAGSIINSDNSNTIKAVTGWEVQYADADTWAVLQTDQADNGGKLYIRKNWGSAATKLTATKLKMLPVGKYRLSLSWNSNLQNMTNLSAYVLNGTSTTIGDATTGAKTLTYDFEVTGAAQTFDIILGFKKTGTGNTPAQLIVDDVALTAMGANSRLMADYDPAALWFDATGYAAARDVAVTPTAPNQVIKAAAANQFSGLTKNVVVAGVCDNLVIADGAPLRLEEGFDAANVSYERAMTNAWGTIILPFALTSDADVQLYSLKGADDENMTFERVASVEANTPVAFKKLTDADKVAFSASNIAIAATTAAHNDNTTAALWAAEGSYTQQQIADYAGIYYIASNKFWAADDAVALNPFRAVFRYSGANPVKSFAIVTDSTDGIVMPDEATPAQGLCHDLGGRLIGTPRQRGIYIRNGKKIIIK